MGYLKFLLRQFPAIYVTSKCCCMRYKHSASMLLPMQWATCFMLLQLPYANCSMQQKMVTVLITEAQSMHACLVIMQGWQLTRTSYTRTPVRSVLCYHVDALNVCRRLHEDSSMSCTLACTSWAGGAVLHEGNVYLQSTLHWSCFGLHVVHCKNTWVTFTTFLGCLSFSSVTKECYQN